MPEYRKEQVMMTDNTESIIAEIQGDDGQSDVPIGGVTFSRCVTPTDRMTVTPKANVAIETETYSASGQCDNETNTDLIARWMTTDGSAGCVAVLDAGTGTEGTGPTGTLEGARWLVGHLGDAIMRRVQNEAIRDVGGAISDSDVMSDGGNINASGTFEHDSLGRLLADATNDMRGEFEAGRYCDVPDESDVPGTALGIVRWDNKMLTAATIANLVICVRDTDGRMTIMRNDIKTRRKAALVGNPTFDTTVRTMMSRGNTYEQAIETAERVCRESKVSCDGDIGHVAGISDGWQEHMLSISMPVAD